MRDQDNLKLSKILNLGLCVRKVFEFTRKLVRNQDKIQMSHLSEIFFFNIV